MMGYLRPYRRMAIIAFVGLVGGNILMVAIPIILRDVIDRGIERNDSHFMIAAGLLVVGLGLLRGIVGFMSRYFGERLSHEIAYDIRNAYYNRVQTLPFSYHDNAEVGTLITRAISDVAEIQRYFAFGLLDGLNTLFLFVSVAIIMLINSPLLAVIALLPMIPLGFFSRAFIMNIAPRWKIIMEETQTLSNHLQENALGAEVVRVFAREEFEIERFGTQNEKLYHEQLGFIKQWASYLPTSAFIVATSTALVLFFGGLMERNNIGNVTVGLVVSFNAYVLLLAQPMRFLGFVILLTTQAISSSERVFEVLDTPDPLVNKPGTPPMPPIKGHVRFENVNFAYDGENRSVLHEINIDAQPGQVIALLGATGSGKTSVVNLIPRFYDVTGGRVTIDDIDVRDVDLHSLRSQIGIVLQNSLLFSATIHDNIAYGKPDASREQVIAAATAANAHDFIMEFPEGYDTLVGERGVTLSGGQRQRIAIARALLIAPRILILDDATSSVDTQTEYLIQRALDKLMEGRTSFVIAQRLSTVLNADQILVLDSGRIVERGTHHELLALNGAYKVIYDLQLAEQERLRREASIAGELKHTQTNDRLATQELQAIADRLASGD
ncbi:MAG: ABC transporter ATP-binding protein [Chloroflexi bacterium]|nr:MAG: ABC transporter ATP-binding protein [Phototrophicales bacterium]RMF79714.1 MAG: ABC transporter ATP-binding protein [Chloroflexota bacterium]